MYSKHQGNFSKWAVTACLAWHTVILPRISPRNEHLQVISVDMQPGEVTASVSCHRVITSAIFTVSNMLLYFLLSRESFFFFKLIYCSEMYKCLHEFPLKLFQLPVYMRLLTEFRQLKCITLKQHLCLRQWKNCHYNKKKTLQYQGRRLLEEYMFDAFMPVFCVLTMVHQFYTRGHSIDNR